MINKLNGRTVEISFGTRSGIVTLTKLTEWERDDVRRVYFTLSHSVKNFPTKGYIDLSGNARIKPLQITVRVGDFFIVVEDGFASSKVKKAEVIRAITELFTLPEEPMETETSSPELPVKETTMDELYTSDTMILATDLRDMIKRDKTLYYGKLRCLPYEKSYGYYLMWGAETIAHAKPCRVWGAPDQLGRVHAWGARGFYFDREMVESIMERIHNGEVPDTFECFVYGSPEGVWPTFEAAKAHVEKIFPSGTEWSIFKNSRLFAKGVIA